MVVSFLLFMYQVGKPAHRNPRGVHRDPAVRRAIRPASWRPRLPQQDAGGTTGVILPTGCCDKIGFSAAGLTGPMQFTVVT